MLGQGENLHRMNEKWREFVRIHRNLLCFGFGLHTSFKAEETRNFVLMKWISTSTEGELMFAEIFTFDLDRNSWKFDEQTLEPCQSRAGKLSQAKQKIWVADWSDDTRTTFSLSICINYNASTLKSQGMGRKGNRSNKFHRN